MASIDTTAAARHLSRDQTGKSWHERRDVRVSLLAGLVATAIPVVVTTPFAFLAMAALDQDEFLSGVFELFLAVGVAVLTHVVAAPLWLHRKLKQAGLEQAGVTAAVMVPVSLLMIPALVPLAFFYPLYMVAGAVATRLIVTARSGVTRAALILGLLAVFAVQPVVFWLATQS